MIFKFHRGSHRATPLYWLRWFPLLINPKKIIRKVYFGFDSKYDLGSQDQVDHNKLFGVGYLVPHTDSARFGWRYDPLINRFIVSMYCYVNRERKMEDLCEAVANHWYTLEIKISNSWAVPPHYNFRVLNETGVVVGESWFEKGHNKKIGMLLGPYFGGNKPAPAEIRLTIKK